MDARDFIKENYGKMPYRDITETLNISLWKLNKIIEELVKNNEIQHKNKIWSKKEEEYVIEWYKKIPNKRIAENLEVTSRQLKNKINNLKKAGHIDNKHPISKNKIKRKIDDLKDEEIYKRMISQPRTKGLADKKFDYPLTIGKKYKVVKLALREGQTRTNETFQGELTQITDNFFVLKNKVGFCECFLKNDYKLGEIKILEV